MNLDHDVLVSKQDDLDRTALLSRWSDSRLWENDLLIRYYFVVICFCVS